MQKSHQKNGETQRYSWELRRRKRRFPLSPWGHGHLTDRLDSILCVFRWSPCCQTGLYLVLTLCFQMIAVLSDWTLSCAYLVFSDDRCTVRLDSILCLPCVFRWSPGCQTGLYLVLILCFQMITWLSDWTILCLPCVFRWSPGCQTGLYLVLTLCFQMIAVLSDWTLSCAYLVFSDDRLAVRMDSILCLPCVFRWSLYCQTGLYLVLTLCFQMVALLSDSPLGAKAAEGFSIIMAPFPDVLCSAVRAVVTPTFQQRFLVQNLPHLLSGFHGAQPGKMNNGERGWFCVMMVL